jgi:MFS family permease
VLAAYGALKDLLSAVYQYPGGWLADRLGRRLALTIFTLLAATGYALYLVSPSWLWVLAGTVFATAWGSMTLPAMSAIVGDNLPPERRAISFAMQSLAHRVPVVVLPPIAGLSIATFGVVGGVRLGLAVSIGMAIVTAAVVWRTYDDSRAPARGASSLRRLWQQMGAPLRRLLLADCLARWGDALPRVFVVLYVLDVLRLDAVQFGALISVQTLVSMASYVPLAKLSDRLNRRPFVLATFALFALFPALLVSAGGYAGALLAFAVAGLREIGEPARKAMIVDLASPATRGRAVGLYYLMRGLGIFPASLIGGALWALGPQWPFWAGAVVATVGMATFALPGAVVQERSSPE